MFRNISSKLFVVLSVAHLCHGLSYWFDSSCSGSKSLVATMKEAQDMAKEGKAQLLDSKNEAMGVAFKTLFKIERSDTGTVKIVTGVYISGRIKNVPCI